MSGANRIWGALLAALLVVAAGAGEARAFSPRTRAEITRRSLTLMPDGMARQMSKHARSLYAGSLSGPSVQSAADQQTLEPGTADQQLAEAIDRAAALIAERRPMSEVARAFGEISRIASDLSYPLNIGPSDPREESIRKDFARYVEAKLPRMSVTFSGFADPDLARDDVPGFARSAAHTSRRDYDAILRSYFPKGRERLPQDFDERSVAFAAASLGVSNAVTTTARAWLYAWHKAHGDMAGVALIPSSAHARPFDPIPAAGSGEQVSPNGRSKP